MPKILQLLYLMLPVYAANMAPPFAKYWHGWNPPISRRWFGDHKTVVGFLLGIAAATVTAYMQSLIGWRGSLVPDDQWIQLDLGSGIGAMGGDTLKSLLKRRVGIPPGKSWIPADQLDFVIGGLAVLAFVVELRPLDVVIILAVTFLGDIGVNHLSFRLGIRDTKW